MFTCFSILWLMVVLMVVGLLLTYFKVFFGVRHFHLSKYKTANIGLVFISVVVVVTLVESIFLSVLFYHKIELSNLFYVCISFASFACAIWTILPDVYPERTTTALTPSFYSLFFGVATFLEILANILFYLSWTHL